MILKLGLFGKISSQDGVGLCQASDLFNALDQPNVLLSLRSTASRK
jgi:hypothetical protein